MLKIKFILFLFLVIVPPPPCQSHTFCDKQSLVVVAFGLCLVAW